MPLPTFDKFTGPKREQLIAAAAGEFARLPYDRVSVFEIARRAGISRSSFYYYFTGKEDLYQYLIDRLRADLLRALPETADPAEIPGLILDFFAAERDGERGPFIARLIERAQSWPRGDPRMAPDPWLGERFLQRGSFDRLDGEERRLICFLVRECLCYQLAAYYRREITYAQLHEGMGRMIHLLHYGVAGQNAGEGRL